MGATKQYFPINFHGGLIEGIKKTFIANIRDFYTVVFGGEERGRGCVLSGSPTPF